MTRVPLTKNLFLDEYIPKVLYLKYRNKPWILQGLIDCRLVKADQMLRDYFGSVMINNWWVWVNNCGYDLRQWSGLRTPASPDYKPESQHTFGRASDKLFTNATAEEVRIYIKKNFLTLGITSIEENVSWVHSDVRWNETGSLILC
jgi:phospholipase C